ITGAVGIRAVLPKSGDRSVDQPWVGGAQTGGVETELGEAADLEILDDDVRLFGEPPHQCGAFRPREIDGGRLLAAVGGEEIGRDLFIAMHMPWRAPMAGIVAGAGPFDLD